jgi:hypothetical protein
MKHGVDVRAGHHLQRVFSGKTVDLIATVAKMQQLEAVL